LKARLPQGWRLSDGERATLAEIGRRLGRKGLQQVARIAKPVWTENLTLALRRPFRDERRLRNTPHGGLS
jgi:hypothetical protein